MGGLRQFIFRIGSVFRRHRHEAELSEEIRFHLESQTEANLAAGMAPEEARLAALRTFGGVDQIKEQYRDERRPRWLEDCWRDLSHSARGLCREKTFTVTFLMVFAVCMGANVAIFTVVDEILIRPLPFPDPGQLVRVYNSYPKIGTEGGVSTAHYLERRQQMAAFSDAAAWKDSSRIITGSGGAESVSGLAVTPSFFHVLATHAAIGRTFEDRDSADEKNPVVVLSNELWRDRYNSDPSAVGRTVSLNGYPTTIIGVMPAGFFYLSRHPAVWMPIFFPSDPRLAGKRHANRFEMIARLRPGVSLAQAQDELDALNKRTLVDDPEAKVMLDAGFHSVIRGLHPEFVSEIRPVLLLLQAGACMLLLIGAVNLANLFLVRSSGRAKEFGVRRALGAGSFRLGRTLVMEALLVSVAGGALGIVLGIAALRLALPLLARQLPLHVVPVIDGTVCAAAFGAACLVGLGLGLHGVWSTLRTPLPDALASESRTGTSNKAVQRYRRVLIVAQVALAFVLVASSGLLGMSLARLASVDPGFRKDNVLTGWVALAGGQGRRYGETGQRLAFSEQLMEALRSTAGIGPVGMGTGMPFGGGVQRVPVAFESPHMGQGNAEQPHFVCGVAGDYFQAMGIPLKEGRFLSDEDVQGGRKLCVVDEDFARRYWPGGGAIGHRISPDSTHGYYTIIGVVGAVKYDDLTDDRSWGAVYYPYTEVNMYWFVFAMRTSLAPEMTGGAFRAAVARIDPDVPVLDLTTMSTLVEESLLGRRAAVVLAAAFAFVSLLIAGIGIYGVLAFQVSQSRREIGVRMALGAEPVQILRHFVGLGIRLTATGLALGLAGAWIAGRSMAGLLFGTGPLDPPVLGGTGLVLGIVAVLACLLPSCSASRVPPAEALRSS